VSTRSLFPTILTLASVLLAGCHVEYKGTEAGRTGVRMVKFENLTDNIPVHVIIPDAHQEFDLAVGETKTVELFSEDDATTFFVEIVEARNIGGSETAQRKSWTGYVGESLGHVVTIRQRISTQIEVHD